MEEYSQDKLEFSTPSATQEDFERLVLGTIEQFSDTTICKRIVDGRFSLNDYHRLLYMLFHQVLHSSSSFAIAGANQSNNRNEARDYLFKHAEEEKSHWRWILNDLKCSGYTGPDPRTQFPPEPAQAYISFNLYVAHKMPLARLGIASMLEGLGGSLSKRYMGLLSSSLKLTPDQALFFFGHGDTDVGHSKELRKIIVQANPDPAEWGGLCFAAQTAAVMYRRMYEEALNLDLGNL